MISMARKIKFKKLKISQNLAQLIIVMAGVFLGMLLTEWNTSRKSSRKKEVVIEQIQIELISNQKILESSIEHKKPFFESLDSLERSVSDELGDELFFNRPFLERFPGWQGVGGGLLDNSMYETAKYSDVIPEMDIELVREISKVYNTQNIYNGLRESFINQFFMMNSTTTYDDALRLIRQIGQELGGYEWKLQQEYKVVLEKLENRND